MSKRNAFLLLDDIIESVNKIKNYVKNLTYDEFIDDSKTVDAVIRNFEIIGEAAKRLPEEFKLKNDQINWFRIIGFRNRVVHDYMGIDFEIVWTIINKDLDSLSDEIKMIL